MFDTTGLTEIKGKKHYGWTTRYYINEAGVCEAKHCSDCKNILPASSFTKSPSRKYGLESRCRDCNKNRCINRDSIRGDDGKTLHTNRQKEIRLRYSLRTDEQIKSDRTKKRPTGTKICKICRNTLLLTDYYSDRGRGDGLESVCISCKTIKMADLWTKKYIRYWTTNNIPIRCYLCDGPYQEIEHVIPTSLGGSLAPENTRPSCISCNRGPGGKHDTPLEEYIIKVNHPSKTKGQILYDLVMSGTWPFTNTTVEEFEIYTIEI